MILLLKCKFTTVILINNLFKTEERLQIMNTKQINEKITSEQMNAVNKSSNMYIGTTIAIMLVIIVIGFIFG